MSDTIPPGSTPGWPATVDAGDLSDSDKTAVSEAAWARANGSMQAYEAFVREHRAGEINLLDRPRASGGQDLSTGRVTSEAGTGSSITETGTSGPSLAEQEAARLSELEGKADRTDDENAELAQLRVKAAG